MMLTVRESAKNLLNSQSAPVLKGQDGTWGSAIFTTADKEECKGKAVHSIITVEEVNSGTTQNYITGFFLLVFPPLHLEAHSCVNSLE